jgi:hypothetical protein
LTKPPALPDPQAFGLTAFADLLPARDPIIGEDPGSFDGFHQAMTATLVPMTPYEGVIAENLIAIEWELLQHRRMRDACLRKTMREEIRKAVVKQLKAKHSEAMDEAWVRHVAAGGTADDWERPSHFDNDAAEQAGDDLAERATSRDSKVQATAYKRISTLGLKPVELMSEAYTSSNVRLVRHEERLQDLERRRREVKRDFDALQ